MPAWDAIQHSCGASRSLLFEIAFQKVRSSFLSKLQDRRLYMMFEEPRKDKDEMHSFGSFYLASLPHSIWSHSLEVRDIQSFKKLSHRRSSLSRRALATST